MREDENSGAGRPRNVSRRPAYLRGGTPGRQEKDSSGDAAKSASEALQGEARRAAGAESREEVLLSWRVWLLPKNPLKSLLVISSTIGMVALAYWAIPQFLFVGLICILILNRLAPYLFPMKYELTETTVSFKTYMASNKKQWSELFCYREFPDGVMLMHDPRKVTGRVREGIFLYYDDRLEHKDEILKIVSSRLRPLKEAIAAQPGKDKVTPKGGLFSAISRIRRLKKNPPGA